MTDNYKLSIKLIGNQKPCHMGRRTGDEWLFDEKTPAGMCIAAYNSLFPFARVLINGGNFSWQDNSDVLTLSCPDHEVVNRFELRRIPETGKKADNYDITLKLVGKGSDGDCGNGHKVGDEWLLDDKTPENICPAAYQIIYSLAMVLRHGGQFLWQSNPGVLTTTCPDPSVANRFEIRRIPSK